MRQARSDTGNVSVSLMRPSFSRWNRSSRVISLDMEAGGIGTMPSFCHSTCPVAASIIKRMLGAGFDRGLRRDRANSESARRKQTKDKSGENTAHALYSVTAY